MDHGYSERTPRWPATRQPAHCAIAAPRIERHRIAALLLATLATAAPLAAADLDVYGDALAAGWEDWSYFATIEVDFDNPAPVHAGIRSIAVTFNEQFAALSLRTAPALPGGDYAALRFWVRGAGVTGTHLAISIQETDGGPAAGVVTLTAPTGAWTEVELSMAELGSPATIARINLQEDGNEDLTATFHVDDMVLVDATPPPQGIFADGFESGTTGAWCTHQGCAPPPTYPPLTITPGITNVAGTNLPSRTVAWADDAAEPREAVMIDQRPGGGGVPAGAGYLRRLTYRVGGNDRVCTGVDGGAIQGFGYVTNHHGDPGDFGGAWGNWSPAVAGTTSVLLAGPHHAILEYAMPGFPLGGGGAPRTIPTTVQWFFATGRSHPIWTVSQDARAYPQGNLGADARSPYGEMAFAGDADNGKRIAGVSWGDTYKFVSVENGTTNESTLLEGSTGWRYDQPNTIPYVLAWTEDIDAEQGTVATIPIGLQDQGADSREFPVTGFGKNQQDLDGPMPLEDDWAYQLMNYPYPPQGGTTNKKMAWGTNPGALGGFDNWGCGGCNLEEFSRHRDSTTPFSGSRENGLLLAYATFVVFGPHGGGYLDGSTGQVVREMERVQSATLTAAVGSVRTQGPRGVGTAANVNVAYVPAGFNPLYASWEIDATANAADVTLTPGAGAPLRHPVFVLHGYTSATPPASITLDGVPGQAGTDYVTTVDTASDRLFVTVLRTAANAMHLIVAP